jgi:DNA-binding MarR family transcriptional regulator
MAEDSADRLVGFGISAADRAVLEFLYPDHELTVPAIASRYQVSRQHVQITVNRLLDKNLLKTKNNPQHKRSQFLSLTAKGKKLFAKVRDDDESAVAAAFASIGKRDVEITRKTLQIIFERLNEGSPK